MSKPAARVGDMHTCPMVTPGTPPIPHVGGPILPPGVPTVLIGNMPAATLGNMCTCVGPPDSIVLGSMTVLIGGKPAARLGDNTAHGGVIVVGLPTVLIGDVGGGGSAGVAAIVSHAILGGNPALLNTITSSPILMDKLGSLLTDGWVIRYGTAGGGSFCDKEANEIVLDPNESGDHLAMTQTLAHEAGHATYTPDPYVAPDGLTRDEYVAANVNSQLKDEGEATLTNAEVREEIMNNSGEDIGIAGTQTDDYERITDSYQNGDIDRDTARQQIGDKFADGETTSTTNESYRDYYSQPYEDYYDDNVGP